MFELITVNVLQRFEKLDSRSRCQVLEQKDWKLSLEIKSNEYISVFPLIFQFPLHVLPSRQTQKTSTRYLKDVLPRQARHLAKTSCRCPKDVLNANLKDIFV